MSKTSVIQRNIKRKKTVKRCQSKRDQIKTELKKLYKDPAENYEQLMQLTHQLQKMPRNASRCRVRNRCNITGRPRGYYRKFGLCRNMLRLIAMQGEVPGLVKSSW